MPEDIRWKLRFANFEKAFLFLKKAVQEETYDELQKAGLIKSFEFTFELAWKTLKDYLEAMGVEVKFPREVIQNAFSTDLIENGHIWIEMLDKRNELTHTYDEEQSNRAISLIQNVYFSPIEQVYHTLKKLQ